MLPEGKPEDDIWGDEEIEDQRKSPLEEKVDLLTGLAAQKSLSGPLRDAKAPPSQLLPELLDERRDLLLGKRHA
jgi:hypothetical protein